MEHLIKYQVERMLRRKRRNSDLLLQPTTRLIHDIGLDSIDLIELTMNLEYRFHIVIPDAELEQLRTVQDVLDCVDTHLAANHT
ncbi:acyl carrier protein [Microvirga sp. STR05]|uniref:Acyl carrier protein n=1 Tax=Hymenobacter duratus TaxID=2771356 RepID=A0ABR8JP17_9BACT|nr:acyl carrier protein [Hymenobacter duratus]MBD2717137.1 acyl carrier protein [Hymenobacter duratus]MBR7952053.1 acyl carrier protein [Microvirga sp. STR05]